MKKLLAIFLCILFVVSPMVISAENVDVIEESVGSDAIFDSLNNFINENKNVKHCSDNAVVVSLPPLSATNFNGVFQSNINYKVVNGSVYNSSTERDYSYTSGQKHTALSKEDRYVYGILNSELQAAYRKIDEAVQNLEADVTFTSQNSSITSGDLYFYYMFDNPQYFYLANDIAVIDNENGTYTFSLYYAVGKNYGEYCGYDYSTSKITDDLRKKILTKKSKFDSDLNNFISTIPSDAPELVKECMIYSKILVNAYYNMDAINYDLWDGLANDNWTAYGIISNGYGVCESYSEAFQALCHAVGIQCTGVVGDAGEPHKWNAVYISGEWYQCDVTFDDPVGGDKNAAPLDYFNLTDYQMINSGHEIEYDLWPTPFCNGQKYGRDNYLAYFSGVVNGAIHSFSNICDATCNNCRYVRTTNGHSYYNGKCNKCGEGTFKGWVLSNGRWLYYEFCDLITNRWIRDNSGWCYVGKNGYCLTDAWAKDSNGWCYLNSSGRIVKNSWIKYANQWYFVNSAGYMLSNRWMKDSKGWVYLGSDGAMQTNAWAKDSVGWCYVGEDGYAVTNSWKNDSFGRCYLDSNGRMATSKWISDAGKWYYFDSNGYMVTNRWVKDSYGWAYVGSEGYAFTNAWVQDTSGWCYVGSDGYTVKNCWRKNNVGWIWFDNNGSMTKSKWILFNGDWYYLDSNGYMVYDTILTVDGVRYSFDENGVLIS